MPCAIFSLLQYALIQLHGIPKNDQLCDYPYPTKYQPIFKILSLAHSIDS